MPSTIEELHAYYLKITKDNQPAAASLVLAHVIHQATGTHSLKAARQATQEIPVVLDLSVLVNARDNSTKA